MGRPISSVGPPCGALYQSSRRKWNERQIKSSNEIDGRHCLPKCRDVAVKTAVNRYCGPSHRSPIQAGVSHRVRSVPDRDLRLTQTWISFVSHALELFDRPAPEISRCQDDCSEHTLLIQSGRRSIGSGRPTRQRPSSGGVRL